MEANRRAAGSLSALRRITRTNNVGVTECCFLNPYEAIHLFRAARHLVRNVTGYPSKRGIYVDECYDIGHIENIHFWPFGVAYKPDDPYCKWVNTQGVAFELARTDWHYVSNTFCFGYGVGYKFSESKAGGSNGNFLGLGADSCRRAVLVEQAQPPGLLITNGEFVGRWGSDDSVCVEIGPKREGQGEPGQLLVLGTDRPLRLDAQPIRVSSRPAPATSSIGTITDRARPRSSWMPARPSCRVALSSRKGTHVQVRGAVKSAILTGNQAEGGFQTDNKAGDRVADVRQRDAPDTPRGRKSIQ